MAVNQHLQGSAAGGHQELLQGECSRHMRRQHSGPGRACRERHDLWLDGMQEEGVHAGDEQMCQR